MKKILPLIFVIISLQTLAQSSIWVKDNAVWHYKYFNFSMPGSGYIKVWDDGDTLIQNKVCTKLKSVKHAFEPINAQWELAEYVSDYISGIVYYSNDTVYRWYNNEFQVLYDFSAQTGDSWILSTGNAPFGCNDTSYCDVESVGSVNLGGNMYNELQANYTMDAYEYFYGDINTRFGPTQRYLFPLTRVCDSMTVLDIDQITFICFEDDSLYYNPTNEACEYYLGIKESALNPVTVFPNPSSGKIELLSEIPLKTIQVMSVSGTTLKEFETNLTLKEIDLSELPLGTYYLKIENSNGEHLVKVIQLSGK